MPNLVGIYYRNHVAPNVDHALHKVRHTGQARDRRICQYFPHLRDFRSILIPIESESQELLRLNFARHCTSVLLELGIS